MKKSALIIACLLWCVTCFFFFTELSSGRSRTEPDAQPPAKHFNEVKLPRGYRPPSVMCRQFKGKHIAVDLFAERFAQGMSVYAEAYPDPSGQVRKFEIKKISFDGRDIALSKRNWGCRALFGIHPETPPGTKILHVLYTVDGESGCENINVPVSQTGYIFPRGALDLGRYSDVDYRPTPEEVAFINKCAVKKNIVFGRSGPDLLGVVYSHPRSIHHITSPFWSKRLIMQYRKNRNGKKTRLKDKLNVHKGIDLRGKSGEPVFSIADGRVVIAEPMYYEGNFLVIDHGNRIFSYYMHLSSFSVKEGDMVKGGQQVASVGSTGLSTAAHLHVSLMIQDINVDPLSILLLPVRN
jgi:murein DD-endopeptidase